MTLMEPLTDKLLTKMVDEGLITFKESVEAVGQRWVDTWHLTAASNLTSIEQYGLRLYPLRKDNFPEHGIWLWAEPLEGMNAHWTIIQRMIDNQTDRIALLRVRTKLSWTWLTVGDYAWLGLGDNLGLVGHHGSISGQHNYFEYHREFPARISLQPIPWHYVTLEHIYTVQ